MQRLKQIVYELPGTSRKSQQFFATLARMLSEVEGCTFGAGQVMIMQRDPVGLLPQTIFRITNSTYPALLFEMDQPLALTCGDLVFRTPNTAPNNPAITEHDGESRGDALGTYIQLPAESEDFCALLPITAVYERLKGHVLRLDHTGVNLPTQRLDQEEWETLLATLAGVSNLYRYPTGEDWPFIVPATADEFADNITDPAPVRKPKFELVYDPYLCNPLIQIDIETDLPRDEIEARFPAPYGVGLPGLDDYFRSVYVHQPWPGLSLRIDMGYRCDEPEDMAGWLVHEGGRIVAN